MKNKKKKIGFTLIELLAVIIVLAIIALIATPIIFNVIENAKLKSLENSCYGIIDGVRTKYAEGLLNSIDGTVKLKGNVTEITVSGEQPIAGTWEIDNSSDSDNRGIKIKDVKFGSMKDYTCTNVNDDGTINSKVTCTKGGDSSNDDNDEDDEMSYYKDVTIDFNIDDNKCVEFFKSNSKTDEEAQATCKGDKKDELKLEIWGSVLVGDKDTLTQITDSGFVEFKNTKIKKSCFNYPIASYTLSVNIPKCKEFFKNIAGSVLTDENIDSTCTDLSKEINSDDFNFEEVYNELGETMIDTLKYYEVIDLSIDYDKKTLTGYRCGVNNNYGAPEITNVKMPKLVEIIVDGSQDTNDEGETVTTGVFYNSGITSVDFSRATNLKKIGNFAFYHNQITGELNLSNLKKLEVIGGASFYGNQISNLDLNELKNLTTIEAWAFYDNQISYVNLNGLINLGKIDHFSFQNNQITSIDLSSLKNLTYLAGFSYNQITSVDLSSLINLKYLSGFTCNQISGELDLSNLKKLEQIDFGAFEANQITGELDLSSLTNLKIIGWSVFNDNQIDSLNLTGLTNLVEIGQVAFENNKISSLDLSGLTNLAKIGNYSFSGNQLNNLNLSGLTNLTIIKNGAFNQNKLSSVDFNDLINLEQMETYAFANNNLSGKLDLSNLKKISIIGNSAFEGNDLTSVEIPNSVTTIGDDAFKISSITSIEIDNIKDFIDGSPWGADNATIIWKRS